MELLSDYFQALSDLWPFAAGLGVLVVTGRIMRRLYPPVGTWADKANHGLIVELLSIIALLLLAGFLVFRNERTSRIEAEESLGATILVRPKEVYHIDGNGRLQGYVLIGNEGSTAAQISHWAIGIAILDATVGDGAETYGDLGPMLAEDGAAVFSPGQHLPRFREGQHLTVDDVEGLRAGAKRVYVYGLISYRDHRNQPHETGFCHMYSGREHINTTRGDKAYSETQARYCPNPKLNFAR